MDRGRADETTRVSFVSSVKPCRSLVVIIMFFYVLFARAVSYYPKHMANYWAKVARMVGTRSAEECHSQHTSQGASYSPAKKATKPKKKKVEPPQAPGRE